MISVNIKSLDKIEDVKMSFSVKFILQVEWFDKRLTWENLNTDNNLNIPAKDVLDNIWVPAVVFENTENMFESSIDKQSILLVKKQGNLTLSSIHEMEEIAYFKGSENPLLFARPYYLHFQCPFELHDYPFDTQLCKILMKKKHKLNNFVEFLPKLLKYTGPKNMAEYTILKIDMKKANGTHDSDVEVHILIKRRVSQHIISTYIPSLCILCIAQVKLIILH